MISTGFSRRLALIGAPMLALAFGTGSVGMTAPAAAAVASARTTTPVGFSHCAVGTVPERDALSADGASTLCRRASSPETPADIAALSSQMRARQAAPFASVSAGAFQAALAQKTAVAAAGVIANSGGAWKPAGTSPLCDGHTTQSNLCPLTDNTSLTLSNGDYTIALLGHKTLSGRITAFAGDPANPNRVFAAPGVGGVFESTDAGASWHSIADALPTQAMGAVAYNAVLHRIYAGTGDNSFGGDAIQGDGIFYSDNDGATWYQSAMGNISGGSESFRVVPDPSDSTGQRVYAAMSKGLFRSTDGGASFTNVNLPTSPAGYTVPDPTQGNAQVSCAGNTTAPLCFFANIVTDVVVKKTATANAPAGAVMAVVGWRAGNRVNKNPDGSNNQTCKLLGVATDCIQSPRNGLYISPTGSSGYVFQSYDPNDPTVAAATATGTTFAANNIVGRTTLGLADGPGQNPDAVFALVQDQHKFQGCGDDPLDSGVTTACAPEIAALGYATVLDGAYASYDFGKTWTKIMNFSQLHVGANSALVGQAGYSPGVQSWYNNWIKPDPSVKDANGNPTRLIFGLEEIWENNITAYGTLPLHQPWVAFQGVSTASSWEVIGRYWNDCGGLNQTGGEICNPGLKSSPIAGTTTHPDQHADLFVPDGNGGVTLFAGSDGGAYKQHVASGGDFSNNNWGDGINTGLYTLQPYDAEIARDGTIVSGLQDNGEMKIAPSGKEAHTIFGGDGFMNTIDTSNTPGASQNIIEEYTYGATSLTLNGGKDWYPIAPGACNSQESQFSTALEQDPTQSGHILEGCTQIQEATNAYANPCAAPPGADPFTCQLLNSPFVTVYDLGLASAPGVAVDRTTVCNSNVNHCDFNVPSALGVRGEHEYVGFCGWCDIVTGGVPFNSGIATNVGGSAPPKIGASDGWHIAAANCPVSSCQAGGKLPKRFITSIQVDPADSNTVYVTMGGYGRRWIPPGSLGDDVSKVGVGNVFVSHDHGENFTNISGNLPDAPANFSVVHNGQLIVGTDVGAFIAADSNGVNWGVLGTGLPAAPIFTMRLQPGNTDRLIISTYGRGDQEICLAAACAITGPNTGPTTTGVTTLPNTAAGAPAWPLVPTGVLVAATAGLLAHRRRRPTL